MHVAFCSANPDLIRMLDDDGTLLIGRVVGFGGDTIRGQAGGSRPSRGGFGSASLSPDLDGSVVLRYHFVPCLTTRSSVACEPEYLEEDPVPFIRLRPPPGIRDVELKMPLPVGRSRRETADRRRRRGLRARKRSRERGFSREGVCRARDRHRTQRARPPRSPFAVGLLVALVDRSS